MIGRLLAGLLVSTSAVSLVAAPADAATAGHHGGDRRTVFLALDLTKAITPGQKVSAVGRVSTRLHRTVRLQLSTPGGWATVAKASTDRRGQFALADTGSRTGTYRVALPKVRRYGAASSSSVPVGVAHELVAPQVLTAGQYITSPNGQWDLLLGNDGNLMITPHGAPTAAKWSTNTAGHPNARAVMQDRGQLVVVDAANNLLWQGGTTGAGAAFQVRDDGTAAIVVGTTVLWTSTQGLIQAPTPAPTPAPVPAPAPTADAASMFARAQSWVDARVKYSQKKWYTNSYGRYRQDCSGFVSLAWNLGYSYTTRTLGSLSHQIGKADLQPGDILLAYNRHVVLFGGWTDATQTSYYGYEETPSTRATYRKIPYPYFSHKSSYLPFRKN